MGTRGRPRARRVLSVVFDTNAIKNDQFDALICRAAKELIARHSNHGDIDIRWVLPAVVRGEREYQMRDAYRNVASHVAKAESLFGQQWGITQETIEQRIAARIDEELARQRIEVMHCDTTRVDWAGVMRRSCFREPPFSRGPTEKGFRDAMICETFIQLATDLTGRDTAVLVSGDQLLKEYIGSCDVVRGRVRVVDDLAALEEDIQLRVGDVDEATQMLIEQRAQQLFYPWDNRDDPTSLWARERLYERIWADHGARLTQTPPGVQYVRIEHDLSNARLVSKSGPRVHFESIYSVQAALRLWVPSTNVQQDTTVYTPASVAGIGLPGAPAADFRPAQGGLLGALQTTSAGEWQQINKASKDSISIRWSATFSRNRRLTRATIDELAFVQAPGLTITGGVQR